jgi:chloride channel protein, CIC family
MAKNPGEPDGPEAGPRAGSLPSLGMSVLRSGLALLWPGAAPLELRMLGRTLLHSALVGGMAGVVGAAFFAGLEIAQRVMLDGTAGYAPLRALGETFLGEPFLADLRPAVFRPWLLALLPALGGLASGLLSRLAPETAGGGGDAAVESYHRGGVVRRRVLLVKALAATCTLGTGGAGGREGPAMQIGGAIGALVGRWLPTSRRERRILMAAGIAAGISAVFRTPLGAALLATEVLYRDDFESDALVPAIIASVVAYSVVISMFGETTLFGQPQRSPFVAAHLALYGLLGLLVALVSVLFLRALRGAQRASARLPVPVWARPAVGGLAMGILGTALLLAMTRYLPGTERLGVFGGGYGVAQAAIVGSPGLPAGWTLVALLAVLCLGKLVASALTIGSGAVAGDFAPSLVMGGLLGSSLGHAAALLFHDPRIHPAAFALVGMGTFYGGVAHAPLSAVVLVAELAGSYDLLVPMMLAVSVAFIALRQWTLYPAQPSTKADSPLAREEAAALGEPPHALAGLCARDLLVAADLPPVREVMTVRQMVALAGDRREQKVLLVLDGGGSPRGLVELGALQLLSADDLGWANAHDVMTPLVSVEPGAPIAEVSRRLAESGMTQIPVMAGVDVVGYVGETELTRAYGRAVAEERAR